MEREKDDLQVIHKRIWVASAQNNHTHHQSNGKQFYCDRHAKFSNVTHLNCKLNIKPSDLNFSDKLIFQRTHILTALPEIAAI